MKITISDKELREAMIAGINSFYVGGREPDTHSNFCHNSGFKRGFDFAMDYIEKFSKGEIKYAEGEGG